jgi:hypothetical protein
MTDGFLGRWSKRKLEVKEGKAVPAEPVGQTLRPPQPCADSGGSESPCSVPGVEPAPAAAGEVFVGRLAPEEGGAGSVPEPPPLLTLEDVKALTAESDFSRFAAAGVSPDVKNAALKKLFSDPHYNIMDRLDVYIDDYSQPDPVPGSMVRQLASVKFLGLFAQEEKAEAEAARDAALVANNPTAQTVAQSEGEPLAVPQPTEHADPDLRLQPDDAAPGEDPGRGAE